MTSVERKYFIEIKNNFIVKIKIANCVFIQVFILLYFFPYLSLHQIVYFRRNMACYDADSAHY